MRSTVSLLVLLLCPALARAQLGQPFDFYGRGPYRPAVPRPEAITGYPAGAQQTMYAGMQHYLDSVVATAPERVRVERRGETPGHRPIRVLIISDAAHLARPHPIRAAIPELTHPRKNAPP